MTSLIDNVRRIVEQECQEKKSGQWEHHIIHVERFATQLARQRGADEELVILAALLHDYAGVKDDAWEEHHIRGAQEAQIILASLHYAQDRIDKVKELILNHRGSIAPTMESRELQILRDADAMAHFVAVPYLFRVQYVIRGRSVDEGREKIAEKLERSWNKLSDEAKTIVREQYEAQKIVLGVQHLTGNVHES